MNTRKTQVTVHDDILAQAAEKGIDEFLKTVTDTIKNAIGGELSADNMESLNVSQITLLAYDILCEEVMDGGFVQLIHNGNGGFIFLNPLAKIMKSWGLADLSKLLYSGRKLYFAHRETIEKNCSDDEFMALFEQFPDFDELDDAFVENEEQWSENIAIYVDSHLDDFVTVLPSVSNDN